MNPDFLWRPLANPLVRYRFAVLPGPFADTPARYLPHGPAVASTARRGSVRNRVRKRSEPSRSGSNVPSSPPRFGNPDPPAEVGYPPSSRWNAMAERLLDPEYPTARFREGRASELSTELRRAIETFPGLPRETAADRRPESQKLWTPERAAREANRISRTRNRIDRLRALERFLGMERATLIRNAAIPGFVQAHAADCGFGIFDVETERDRTPPIARMPEDRPRRVRFPALVREIPPGDPAPHRLAATPDGRFLAIADAEGRLIVRDGREIDSVLSAGHAGHPVEAVDLSTDGRRLVSVDRPGPAARVAVRDARTGNRLFSAPGSGAAKISADGRRLLWENPSGHLRVADLAGPDRIVGLFEPQSPHRHCLSISADGRTAVSARGASHVRDDLSAPESHVIPAETARTDAPANRGNPFEIRIWNLDTGQIRHILPGHGARVRHLALAPDGRTAASVGDDRRLRFWDCRAGRSQADIPLPPGRAAALALAPDGSFALTAHPEGIVRVWDSETGELVKSLRPHPAEIRTLFPVDDGRRAWAVYADGMLRELDIHRGESAPFAVGGSIEWLETTPDGRHAMAGGATRRKRKEIRIWDLRTGTPLARRTPRSLPVQPFQAIRVSPRGDLALSAHCRFVHGWRFPDGDSGFRWRFPEPFRIRRLEFTPTGDRAILLSESGDLFAGPPGPKRPAILSGDVSDVAAAPDGRHLLLSAPDRGVEVWDLSARTCRWRLPGMEEAARLRLDPGGRRLALVTRGGELRVLDLRPGRIRYRYRPRPGTRLRPVFAPGGRRLVVVEEALVPGVPGRVFAIRLGTRPECAPLDCLLGDGPVQVRIVPDGSAAAVAECPARDIHLLDLPTGRRVGCVSIPADAPPLIHLGEFGIGGVLPAADADGRVIRLAVEASRAIPPVAKPIAQWRPPGRNATDDPGFPFAGETIPPIGSRKPEGGPISMPTPSRMSEKRIDPSPPDRNRFPGIRRNAAASVVAFPTGGRSRSGSSAFRVPNGSALALEERPEARVPEPEGGPTNR